MNLWHDIAPARVRPEDFFAVIEIEKGSKNKYEMDKETGALRLDRILYTSTHYPANYGFIPRTWADDGDPLDILLKLDWHLIPPNITIGFLRYIGNIVITRESILTSEEALNSIVSKNESCHTLNIRGSFNKLYESDILVIQEADLVSMNSHGFYRFAYNNILHLSQVLHSLLNIIHNIASVIWSNTILLQSLIDR